MSRDKQAEPREADSGEWRLERPATDGIEVRRRHAANRSAFNEGARTYAADIERATEFLASGNSNMHPIERRNLERYGPLPYWCRTAVHLQCAGGLDTLSLLVEGAGSVVGIDISDAMIEAARELSRRTGMSARWYCCDVIDTPAELDRSADLVYTGRGALPWIHDLTAWAAVVERLLRPGGVVCIYDSHPFQAMISWESSELTFAPQTSCFDYADSEKGWSDEYIGEIEGIDVSKQTRKYERVWPVAEVVQALIDAGLVLDRLGEHTEDFWRPFPALSDPERTRIPNTFSVCARKR